MGSDGEDSNFTFGRTVVPKNAVSRWRPAFRVGFEDLLASGTLETRIFMGVEAGMVKVGFQ